MLWDRVQWSQGWTQLILFHTLSCQINEPPTKKTGRMLKDQNLSKCVNLNLVIQSDLFGMVK